MATGLKSMKPARVSWIWAGCLSLCWLVPVGAAAQQPNRPPNKQACMDAYVQAQRLRREDKLLEAQEQLLVCAHNKCPKALRTDCVMWSAEVEESIPTVVFEVKGPDGTDLVDAKVMADGELVAEQIDGKPVPIDPGVHALRFEVEGQEPLEQQIVVRTGEKNRLVAVQFEPDEPPVEEQLAVPEPVTADSGTKRPTPVAAYVLGGVGLAALGGFTYMALKFEGQVQDLEQCKPNCTQGQVDDASKTRTLSFIPLGVGLASLGAATYLYLTRPEQPPSEQARGPVLDVAPTVGGAFATIRASF